MPYNFSISFGLKNPKRAIVGYDMYVRATIVLLEEAAQSVSLSVSGLPSGVTSDFPDLVAGRQCCTPTSLFQPEDVVLRLIVSGSATPGSYTVTVTAVSGGQTREADYDFFIDAVPSVSTSPVSSVPVIPLRSTWESNFTTNAPGHAAEIADTGLPFGQRLDATYYDAERVYYQGATYFANATYNTYAGYAEEVYRDLYVIPAGGLVTGYFTFTRGIRLDFERTADSTSDDTVILMSEEASYTRDVPLLYVISAELSREVSYAIMAYIDAEKVGNPRNPRLVPYVDILLGHFDQWMVSYTARAPDPFPDRPEAAGWYYVQPFMIGLACAALIQYYEEIYQDPRIPYFVKLACDWMWEKAWVTSNDAFWYENYIEDPNDIPAGFWASPHASGAGSPDLNLLIAPAYAWLHHKIGYTTYQINGDEVWIGGINGAYLGEPKQFNQNYWWSFDYITWRLDPLQGNVVLLGACLSE